MGIIINKNTCATKKKISMVIIIEKKYIKTTKNNKEIHKDIENKRNN